MSKVLQKKGGRRDVRRYTRKRGEDVDVLKGEVNVSGVT